MPDITAPFKLEQHLLGAQPRKLKVAVIGAGFAGITAGVRLPERLGKDLDLTIFEKNAGVGGTWYENRYPGAACDIPAPMYTLSFEDNPQWSRFYVGQAEILAYLERVADKYKVKQYIKFQHRLNHAQWNETTGQWSLTFAVTDSAGSISEFQGGYDFVIQGMGCLNKWVWPEIEGREDFKGRLQHSANYSGTAEEEKGRRVAVIGSGSSAIQIVPQLQPLAAELDVYARSRTWICPDFGSLGKADSDLVNLQFSQEQRDEWAANPDKCRDYRVAVETESNSGHAIVLRGSHVQREIEPMLRAMMTKKLAAKPEIAKAMIPDFEVACRRLTPGPGYLEALVEPNVNYVTTHIKRFTATGIEAVDGTHREYDTIICATGFDLSHKPWFPVIGRNGVDLRDEWAERPHTYLSMTPGPNFPNWWIAAGPNSGVGSGSFLLMIENAIEYATKVLAKMRTENLKAVSAKQESIDDFEQYADEYFKTTVFSGLCRSWYKNGTYDGPVTGLWPGSCLHAYEILSNPRWEDFDYTRLGQRNRFAWFGNGSTAAEMDPSADKVPYLRLNNRPAVPV